MSLTYSTVPYKGIVQVSTDNGPKNVCWGSLKSYSAYAFCRHLGYSLSPSIGNVRAPTQAKEATFSGSINCYNDVKFFSQCSISTSSTQSCSELSYMECKFVHYGALIRSEKVAKSRMVQ